VSQAKAALAAIADRLIGEKLQEEDIGRIETREDLKFAEKQMSTAAQDAGLQSVDFGLFKNAGFLGMYNMSLKELVVHKGSDVAKTLYDFMGLEELAGNLFRVTQTAARIKNKGPRGRDPLLRTAKEVGAEVRQMMIKNSGVAPETLPVCAEISESRKRFKKIDKQMKRLDGTTKKPGTSG
jgi:DNA-damage-inducible protein D